jgi:hypothetical protein
MNKLRTVEDVLRLLKRGRDSHRGRVSGNFNQEVIDIRLALFDEIVEYIEEHIGNNKEQENE